MAQLSHPYMTTGKTTALTIWTFWQSDVSALVAQMVKCLPTVLETYVPSLGWEDPLEKKMATHSTILGTWWATVNGVTKSWTQLSD